MRIETDVALGRYTTYQIGGPADYFVEASSREELVEALDWAKTEGVRVFVFGGGSNLLFDDAGFRGLVIRLAMKNLRVAGEEIYAEAGCKIFELVSAAQAAGLSGLEGWNGLPGTVGGAVFGNAGCFGVEARDVLKSAEIFDGEKVRKVGVEFFEYEYRNSSLKKSSKKSSNIKPVVLSATFKLSKGNPEDISAKMKEVLISRATKQPPGSSTGSFFKNPSSEQPAGMLIEACGLKGRMIGRAQISEAHANFFLNRGGASSADILALAELAEAEVFKKFAVNLEREVEYVAP